MSWITRRTHRVAARVAASTDGDVWRRVVDDYGVKYVRRRGAHFPDMDALGSLLEQLSLRNGNPVSASAPGLNGNVLEAADARARIAHLAAPADRSSVSFTAQRAGVEGSLTAQLQPSWSLDIRSAPGSAFYLHELGSEPRKFAESVLEIAERHIVDAARGTRATSAVVEPISLQTASQRAHDAKVATKAARVGGFWGAVAGAVVGGAITFFADAWPG